jgi:hypothetical protein
MTTRSGTDVELAHNVSDERSRCRAAAGGDRATVVHVCPSILDGSPNEERQNRC